MSDDLFEDAEEFIENKMTGGNPPANDPNPSNEQQNPNNRPPLPPRQPSLPQREEAHGVSVKLPPFWDQMPDVWFQKIESQFDLCDVRQELTRYNHLMSVVTPEIAARVVDTLRNPGPTPYTTLKNALLSTFTPRPDKALRELLVGCEIGDDTPSSLYRRMSGLVIGLGYIDETFLVTLWAERLPPQARAIIKTSDQTNITQLLKTADMVYETLQTPAVESIRTPLNDSNRPEVSLAALLECNRKMEQEISELRSQMHRRGRNRFYRNRSDSRGRNNDGSNSGRNRSPSYRGNSGRNPSPNHSNRRGLCFYHERFGSRAHKCENPCSWTQNSQHQSEGTPEN